MYCLPFMPRSVGATRSEGGRSPGQRGCFSEGQERIVCVVAKAKPPICEGNRNPAGWKYRAQAPSAGITLKPSPNERDMKGRPACTTASYSVCWPKMLMHCALHSTAVASRRSQINRLGRAQDKPFTADQWNALAT